jgi:hypothetical protein
MKLIDPFQNPLLETCSCYFGGGGGAPKAPKQQKIELPPMPSYNIPETPAPPPMPAPVVPAPPVSASAAEVQQEKDQQKIDATKRQGIRKTLIAGEANQKPASPVTGSTLLG